MHCRIVDDEDNEDDQGGFDHNQDAAENNFFDNGVINDRNERDHDDN